MLRGVTASSVEEDVIAGGLREALEGDAAARGAHGRGAVVVEADVLALGCREAPQWPPLLDSHVSQHLRQPVRLLQQQSRRKKPRHQGLSTKTSFYFSSQHLEQILQETTKGAS